MRTLQVVFSHQNVRNVLRLHYEEFIISNNGFKELQRHGAVLVAADATGDQLKFQSLKKNKNPKHEKQNSIKI